MADSISKRYAIVTGSNKGIGFAICKLLASKGIVVVLTARDEKRGLEAVNKLNLEYGLSDLVFFHQLNVCNPTNVSSLADFIKRQFGKLDILVNNASVVGCTVDADALRAAGMGKAKNVFSDAERLTKEKVDEVLKEFLKDFRQGSLGTKGWPAVHSVYLVSKAVLNAYTRILVAKYPKFRANCVCPVFVKMDILHNTSFLTPEEGTKGPVSLSLLPNDGPSGRFFQGMEETSFLLYEKFFLPNGKKFIVPNFN